MSLTLSERSIRAPIPEYKRYGNSFSFWRLIFPQEAYRMAGEKTARELIYETNRDVKWICRALTRMEARDEDFEGRLRALEA